MKYHFKVHAEVNGFWGECCELAGCVSQGNTLEDLKTACQEALNLFLEEPDDSRIVFPLPDDSLDTNRKLEKIPVDPEIALAVLLRDYRSSMKLTQKQAAGMLGMKNVYSYQRLEKKSNPTLSLISKIHTVFPGIGLGDIL